jgi:type I restriction-modification system DNA methylase subunit
MTNHVHEFIKELNKVKDSKNGYELFNDFLTLTAATLYLWKKDKKAEEEYLSVSKQYTKEELLKFGKLLDITIDALTDNQEQDFLGDVFQLGEYNNDKKGQFFTPYHISHLMASMTVGEDIPKEKIYRVIEPCCGAGGMMIATVAALKEKEFDFQNNAFFIGIDIDERCARMAYIQCSLLGIPAVIICGNSLTNEEYWQRETFGFFFSGMRYKLKTEELINGDYEPITAKDSEKETKQSVTEIKLPPARKQGELF